MQLKLFILPVKNLAGAEAEMNAFLRSHRVLVVKKEFAVDGENALWRRNHLPYADWRMRSWSSRAEARRD